MCYKTKPTPSSSLSDVEVAARDTSQKAADSYYSYRQYVKFIIPFSLMFS